MILREILREAEQRTHVKARRNSKRIIITACILSAFLTVAFYAAGIPQKDPLYANFPVIAGIPVILVSTFNAVAFTSIVIFFLKSLGEITIPKAIDGCSKVTSKIILRDPVKKDMADGIWDYIKIHREHDPLYQADLEAIRNDFNQKLEQTKTDFTKKLEQNTAESDKKLEDVRRELRIKNLAINKITNLKKQAERKRDENARKLTEVSHLLQIALRTIFSLEKIIRKLKGE